MKPKKTPAQRFSFLVRLLVLTVLGVIISMPFIWMVSASFKPLVEVDNVNLVPHHPTLQNYPIVLSIKPDPGTGKYVPMQFGRWYFNSVFIAVGTTLFQVLTSALAAFAFSRLQWKGRDTVFLMYLATMMIPGVVLMIPNYQTMVTFHFIDTYRGLIIPAAFSAFGTFLLRQFMLSISPALDEAATIDGAGPLQIFWEVILPLARPGLIALTIITFLGAYQSFFWPLIMLSNAQLYPMSVGMLNLDSSYGQQTELIMAASVMNVVPLIIIFVTCQKFLVSGLQLGGVKG
jgi:multiple sugar transport system permease protein